MPSSGYGVRRACRTTQVFVLLAAALLLPLVADAQQHLPSAQLEFQVEQAALTAARWQFQARLYLVLTIAIGVLGALIVLVQRLSARRWASIMVAFVGFVITALTVVTNTAFDADYRSLGQAADDATSALNQARNALALWKGEANEDNKEALLNEAAARLSEFQWLERKLLHKAVPSSSIVPKASASDRARPRWLSEPPGETATTFLFVGMGADPSLRAAMARSRSEANQLAAQRLSISIDLVQRVGRAIDTYLEYDSKAKLYRYFTLLEVNRALVGR